MTVSFSKDAVKVVDRMDVPTRQRVKQSILAIPKGDIKPLKGAKGTYRLRVGDWRILFSYLDNETVYIRDIGPRGDIYKGG